MHACMIELRYDNYAVHNLSIELLMRYAYEELQWVIFASCACFAFSVCMFSFIIGIIRSPVPDPPSVQQHHHGARRIRIYDPDTLFLRQGLVCHHVVGRGVVHGIEDGTRSLCCFIFRSYLWYHFCCFFCLFDSLFWRKCFCQVLVCP